MLMIIVTCMAVLTQIADMGGTIMTCFSYLYSVNSQTTSNKQPATSN